MFPSPDAVMPHPGPPVSFLARHRDALTGLLLSLCAFVVYLRTMSPGVGTEDPGEIAAALHTMGIIHPTGYPLYTMLGSLFVRMLPGEPDIWRMNLFGAVLTAASVFFFHGTFRFLLSERGRALFGAASPAHRPGHPGGENAGAIAATAIFAFSAVFWFEAVSVEVYALHLVFLAAVTRLFLEALVPMADAGGREAQAERGDRPWILFAYVLGLSFAHHMMTVLLAPAFLWLFFRTLGFGRAAWGRIAVAVPPFLTGLSAYLYLPLRSAAAPVMNWGEPSTLPALWKHVTAAQYGQQMFSSWEIAGRKLAQFAADLPADFGWPALALAAAGLWLLARRGKRARGPLVFSLLVFATGLFYAVNYAFDDPNFHLHPHFMVALWAGVAIGAAWEAAHGWWRIPLRAACALGAISSLLLVFPRMDKSRDTLVDDYARNVLSSLDSGGVLFTNEYERFGSPAFYLQMVKGFREDAVVLDVILLGNPWFFSHLEARHPWLVESSRPEVGAYRAELDRFIDGPADTLAYQARLREMFRSLIERSREAGRPVYFTSNINAAEAPGYRLVPSGMVFRLEPEDQRPPYIPPRDFAHAPLPPERVNRLSEKIRVEYAEGYANQGAHLLELGDTTGAAERFRRALATYPEFPEVRRLLNSVTGMP